MKKLTVLLLAMIIALSLFGCVNPKIKEVKISGDEITHAQALELVEGWDKAAKEAPLSKGKWYSVSYDIIMDTLDSAGSDESVAMTIKVKANGKIFLSPHAFENKMHLTFDGEVVASELLLGGEKKEQNSDFNIELTFLEGQYYVKMESKAKSDEGVQENTIYSSSDGIIDDILGEAISIYDALEYSELVMQYDEAAKYYKTKSGLISKFDSANNSSSEKIEQNVLLEIDGDDGALKKVQVYMNVEIGDGSDKTKIKAGIEIKKCLTGSVTKPKDAWKY